MTPERSSYADLIRNSTNGNGKHPKDQLSRFEVLVENAMTARSELFRKFQDPRRDIEAECGYPETTAIVPPQGYQDLYDRESIAGRVVELMPRECWQIEPMVYEDESTEKKTEFEEAWNGISKILRSEKSYYQDERGSPIWDYLRRIDELSGIGQFGCVLLGFDDGRPLDTPIGGDMLEGIDEIPAQFPMPNPDNQLSSTVMPHPRARAVIGSQSGTTAIDKAVGNPYKYEPGPKMPDDKPRAVPGELQGTDAQYTGVQFSQEVVGKKKDGTKLLFIRVFPESLVQIVQYESNVRSPRFGLPVRYWITLTDPREQQHAGVGLPQATVYVHWTRVIHIADTHHAAASSEILAVQRMRPVLNRLLDLRKLYSGSAEMYWRGAFPGIILESNPQMGPDVIFDETRMKDLMENYMNGLQRYMALMGWQAKGLAPQVVDPSAQIEKQLEAISIKLGCPMRVLKGSERGELASSQDDDDWNGRVKGRRNSYLTPKVIVPFVDRLISTGVLPEPKDGYSVEWPEPVASASQKADIGVRRTQALVQFTSAHADANVTLKDWLVRFMGFEEEEADAIIEAQKGAQEDKEIEAQLQQMLAADSGGMGGPPPGMPGQPPGAPPNGAPNGQPPGVPNFGPKPPSGPKMPPVGGGAAKMPPMGGPKPPTGNKRFLPLSGPRRFNKPLAFNPLVNNRTAQIVALKEAGRQLAKSDKAMPGYGQIFLHEKSGDVWYVGGDGDEREWADEVKDRLMKVSGIEEVKYESEEFPKKGEGWLRVYPSQKRWIVTVNAKDAKGHGSEKKHDTTSPSKDKEKARKASEAAEVASLQAKNSSSHGRAAWYHHRAAEAQENIGEHDLAKVHRDRASAHLDYVKLVGNSVRHVEDYIQRVLKEYPTESSNLSKLHERVRAIDAGVTLPEVKDALRNLGLVANKKVETALDRIRAGWAQRE